MKLASKKGLLSNVTNAMMDSGLMILNKSAVLTCPIVDYKPLWINAMNVTKGIIWKTMIVLKIRMF